VGVNDSVATRETIAVNASAVAAAVAERSPVAKKVIFCIFSLPQT